MSGFANLTLGMEEFAQGENTEGTVPQLQAQVNADAAQLTQDATEIESAQVATDEAVTQGEVLGQVQDTLQASVDAGEGVSPETAQVAEIAVEGICALLRLPRTSRMAQENFGSVNGRVSATKLAIESIGESIKALFERIKAIAKRVGDKIQTFVANLFKSTKMLSKHLESLKGRVEALSDSAKPKESTLDNPSLARGFSVDKKADLSTVKRIMENSTKLLASKSLLSEQIIVPVSKINSLIEKSNVTDEDFKKTISEISAEIGIHIDAAFKGIQTVAANAVGNSVGPFAACRVIFYKNQRDGSEKDGGVGFSLSMQTVATFEADKIVALKNKREMAEVLEMASALLGLLEKSNGDDKKLEKLNKDILVLGDKALSAMGKLTEGNEARTTSYRKMASSVQQINSVSTSLGMSIPKAVYDAVRLAADYVSASLANVEIK